MLRRWACFAGVLTLLSLPAQAQTNHLWSPQTLAVAVRAVTNTVDRGHEKASNILLDAVDRLDLLLHASVTPEAREPSHLIEQFYGDRHVRAAGAAGSYVTITPEVTFSDDPAAKFNVDFSAHIKLRRLSDRLELFVDRFEEDADLIDGVLGRVNQRLRGDSEEKGGAGLLYHLPDYFALKSSFSVGVAFKPMPVLRLKYRARITSHLDHWQIRLSETPFWESDDGFGEKTQLEFIRPLSTATVFRTSSGAVWSETSEGVDLGQSVVWSHSLSQRRTISFRAGVAGHTEPSAIVDLYSVRATWRQRVYRNWLYLEVEPGVDFPDDRNFEAVPLLSIRFDVILGAAEPDS